MRTDAPIISCFHVAMSQTTSPGGKSRKLLDDITLDVQRGSWSEFVGPSGAGKSLLFGILSLRMEPDQGKLVIDGRNYHRLGRRGVAELRRRIHSCGEDPVLLERRTVIENLVLPFVVRREEQKALPECDELLAEAAIAHLRDVPVQSLSRQERLVVGVIRAVAGRPQMVLVDDVLHQVDETARTALVRMLQRRHLDGATVVLFGRERSANARRATVYLLEDGRLDGVEENALHQQTRTPETGLRV